MKNMKILFMGTSDFAVSSLEFIKNSEEEVIGIVTMPDRQKGRGMKLKASPVKEFAIRKDIAVFQPGNVKDQTFISKLRELKPDVVVVVAFGQILPKEILMIPRLGCINLHASLLPRYRGAAPINWAIINGDKVTGVTTIYMDENLDTGGILLQQEIEIEDNDTAESLHNKLAKVGAHLLLETLKRHKQKSITPIFQDNSKATPAPKLKKKDGLINWNKGSVEISNLIRGLNPKPGAFSYFDDKILKIFSGISLKGDTKEITPGTISEITKEGIRVSTGKGFLLIKEVQLQNHNKMGIRDFLSGQRHRIHTGTILK
ncbi:MAG: methionyl-tRNA formyltransferase [Thermodesulfobacteriota bacterium]|nr:methionyl-tRNA formyltransferase [Thermodesulfobacteriota bacterium]